MPDLLGAVKTKVWDYEKETRVRCYVDVKQGVSSVDWEATDKLPKKIGHMKVIYRYPDFYYVYCSIPEDTIKNMKITFSPFMTDTQKNTVIAAVKHYMPDFNTNNFQNSKLEGKIRVS